MSTTVTLQCLDAVYGTSSYNTRDTTFKAGESNGNIYQTRLEFSGTSLPNNIGISSIIIKVKPNSDTSNVQQRFLITKYDSYSLSNQQSNDSFTFNYPGGKDQVEISLTQAQRNNFESIVKESTWYIIIFKGDSSNTYVNFNNNTESLKPTVTITYDIVGTASQPTISPTTGYIGDTLVISTNRTDNTYTHTLTYSFGNIVNASIASGVGASYSWRLPSALSSEINGYNVSKEGTIDCWTYNGNGQQVGDSTIVHFYAKKRTPNPPVINYTSLTSSTTVNSQNVFVQGQSAINVSIGASPQTGTTITKYSVTINGTTYQSSSSTFSTPVLNLTGTKTVTIMVTDSNGGQATSSSTVTYHPYITPTITVFNVERCKADGSAYQSDGTSVRYSLTASVANIDNDVLNPITSVIYCILYRQTGETSWIFAVPSTSFTGHTLTQSNILIGDGFDVDKSYEFKAVVSDVLENMVITYANLSTRNVVFDVYKNGTGFAIGKVAQYGSGVDGNNVNHPDGFFDVQWDSEFHRNVVVDGDLTVGGTNAASHLKTPRNIALTGLITGNADFDGSDNISISTTMPYVLGWGYGGTGMNLNSQTSSSSSSLISFLNKLGIDIRYGYVGVGDYRNIWLSNPMQGVPIVMITQKSGTIAAGKVSTEPNQPTQYGFQIESTNSSATYWYLAISCPWSEVSS